ncbi:PREDICTED: protein artemis isoform X1 [Diuraphis noxia]|uniref:protein artemis isoform X1 n=1 Tax=Diuraphis noxia TaxID=143948 RepID=UPI00076355F6|nr:PREDICTED: protein artemis isoform X1 [Diuraphis noxia]
MSTFCGKLEEKELAFIGIDSFESHLLSCSTFMLSHFHKDHMRGIQDQSFQVAFNNTKNNMMLYASPLTITYLKRNKTINLREDKLISLEIGFPNLLKVHSENFEYICVTLLPAGHCPGSVMFLIEAGSHRILYTGDFRVQLQDFKQFKALLIDKDGNCSPKNISALYLDTTFASKMYYEFPTRKESSVNLIKVVEEWLDQDSNNKICLWMPGYVGIEYAIVEVAKHFKCAIHVHKQKYEELYSSISDLDNYVTPIFTNNRIHACSKSECDTDNINCMELNKNVKCVQLNALAFTKDVIDTAGHVIVKNNITRVCYSSHPSCKELREIVKFLNPEKLYFNVIVNQTTKEIYNVLTENNWTPRTLKEDVNENTKVILKLSNKYKFNHNIQNKVEEVFNKRPRLESPERE